MSARRSGIGIAVGVVAMAMSFVSAASALATGHTSQARLPLVFFAMASISLLYLVYRRQKGKVAIDHVNRLKLGAALFLVFGMLMSMGLIAFAVAETVMNHAYGWLLLVPFALWVLRLQVVGVGNVLRASPDDPNWPRSGGVPL